MKDKGVCCLFLFSRVVLSLEEILSEVVVVCACVPRAASPGWAALAPPLQAEVPGGVQVGRGGQSSGTQPEAQGVPRFKAGLCDPGFLEERTVSWTARGPLGGPVWSLWSWWFLSAFDFAKFLNRLHTLHTWARQWPLLEAREQAVLTGSRVC